MGLLKSFILSILFITICTAQWNHFSTIQEPIKRQQISEEDKIKSMINELVAIAQKGDSSVTQHFLSKITINESFSKILSINGEDSINVPQFYFKGLKISDMKISVAENSASVEFMASDHHLIKNKKETMELVLTSGHWRIKTSNFFINCINKTISSLRIRKQGDYIPQTTLSTNPNIINISLNNINNSLSKTSIIQRTSYDPNFLTINKSLTQSYLHVDLFSNPTDGKYAWLNTNNILGVLSDEYWDRIVFAEYSPASSSAWSKSYGDNSNEPIIKCPSSIGLDKFGNIYVLSGLTGSTVYPKLLYHLTYNDNNKSIASYNTIPITNIQDPVDFYLDWNEPDVPSDDCIWIADCLGNSVHEIGLQGNQITQFSKVKQNENDNNPLYLNKPTKIIAKFYNPELGLSSMAIIDSDKKRLIIISDTWNIQDDALIGPYQAFQFSDETNTSLNSMGFYYENRGAIWVLDKSNGLIHIFTAFGYTPYYLGSVKSTENNNPQWINPKFLESTAMSNSNGDDESFITMDNWDNNNGINTYYPGADVIPTVNYGSSGSVNISASITCHCTSGVNLCRYDGSIISSEPAGEAFPTIESRNYDANALGNSFGKYYLDYSLYPYKNSIYLPNYKWTQPKHVRINFALPVAGNFTGDTSGMNGVILTWHTNITSGSGDFSYKWYMQNSGENNWNLLSSTSSSQQYVLSTHSITIKCDITDNYTGLTKSFSQYVHCLLSPTLYLTALIEAMYVSGGTSMTMSPTITVELHSPNSPYRLLFSQTGNLSTSGTGIFTFQSAQSMTPYYIVLKSVNTIETWSSEPHDFISNELTYDFTTGTDKVYSDGSNPPLAFHNGKYCIYSGDCNQDGQVTTDDYTGIDNDNSNFEYHIANDVNGDGYITTDDCTFIDNNSYNFIQKQIPNDMPALKSIKQKHNLVDKNNSL
jgi:hypothetical protein